MESALDILSAAPCGERTAVAATLVGLQVSSLLRTRPVSEIEQPDFFNAAAVASTRLEPADLLAVLKACERLHGRRRTARWGPRPLDLDLLLYDDIVVERPELWIPHRQLRERRFYLQPLAQIAPRMTVPPDGATVAELLAVHLRREGPIA